MLASFLWKIPLILLVVCIVIIAVALVIIGRKDGPTGPIPGGAFTSGTQVTTEQIDWNSVLGSAPVVELELALQSTGKSRTTGAFVHENSLYIPCDLGYVWRRMPDPTTRMLLRTLWWFKTWHIQAEADGRAVLRIDGKLYPRHAVRVHDPALNHLFRQRVMSAAEQYFGHLADLETNPADIWFFRMDPPLAAQPLGPNNADS